MIIAQDIGTLRRTIREWRDARQTIALVPTMGFFHNGHLELMREAKRHCRRCVTTIFVNPKQFGPSEDLGRYPHDLERDIDLARAEGVDLLFTPTAEEIYPPNFQTTVSLSNLSQGLCGASRPGHFDGVATVVAKLFNLVQPDVAVFGLKDYQQLALVRQMAADLNFTTTIIGHPTVREQDGLAMSSRNSYLSPESRRQATCLYEALTAARARIRESGPLPANLLKDEIRRRIGSVPGSRIDYVEVVEAETLRPKATADQGDLLALAVFFDDTVRLIDNTLL